MEKLNNFRALRAYYLSPVILAVFRIQYFPSGIMVCVHYNKLNY